MCVGLGLGKIGRAHSRNWKKLNMAGVRREAKKARKQADAWWGDWLKGMSSTLPTVTIKLHTSLSLLDQWTLPQYTDDFKIPKSSPELSYGCQIIYLTTCHTLPSGPRNQGPHPRDDRVRSWKRGCVPDDSRATIPALNCLPLDFSYKRNKLITCSS